MLSPIPKARYSPSSSRPPMSRIITVRCHCCGPSDECSPNCATSSPIASIADQSCWTQSPSWAGGRSRSSPDPRPSGPSSQSLDDGSSNAPSLGSDATVALPRISRQASPAPRRGSWWQASACSLAASQGLEMTGIIMSQTLRKDLKERIGGQIRGDLLEVNPRPRFAFDPQADSGNLVSPLADDLSEIELAIKFESARVHGEGARRRARLGSLVD